MLWITPFLFPTVAVHAFLVHDFFNAAAVLLLYGTSLCVHSNPALFGPTHPVTMIDKALCFVISVAVAKDTLRLPQDWLTAIVWFSLAYMPVIYYFKISDIPRYDPRQWYPWHTSLHLVTVAGMHCLFVAKARCRTGMSAAAFRSWGSRREC